MIYCATKFTYDRDRRRFTAEASDFGPAPFMHRVYNDAMDMGIKVRGKNSVVLFYLTTERKDAEGDVKQGGQGQHWFRKQSANPDRAQECIALLAWKNHQRHDATQYPNQRETQA